MRGHRVTNPDIVPLPWGFGTHPYFKLPLSPESDPARCLVEAPATELWELIDCLPTGQKQPIPPEIDLRRGAYSMFSSWMMCSRVCPKAPNRLFRRSGRVGRIANRTDHRSGIRELVAYIPPGRAAVCLEPYTCVTDAINLEAQGIDAGWKVLPPGRSWTSWIEIRAGRIIV